MQIFKFGGASLNTSKAVKNMTEIVCREYGPPIVVIVSAMGKSTNSLEEILNKKITGEDYQPDLNLLVKYHLEICSGLFPDPAHEVFEKLNTLFETLGETLKKTNQNPGFDEMYDSVVSYGELISSLIVYYFLSNQVKCHLLDARKVIKTDDCYREGKILWDETGKKVRESFDTLHSAEVIVSQGFIGSTLNGKTTTLGREGSDFTAAIFASVLNAKQVTFWKDVPGIMNADPKIIKDALLLEHLPYKEAAEMTFYGAKVIHPKTIRPLANKDIPLFVKGFDHPDLPGTSIKKYDSWKRIPVIIYKRDQYLISCKFTDFSFVNEESLVLIFDALQELDIKVNMMQNSAISFSTCIDFHPVKTHKLIESLSGNFEFHYNSGLTLITIINYTKEALEKYRPKENILLEQQTRANYQAVVID